MLRMTVLGHIRLNLFLGIRLVGSGQVITGIQAAAVKLAKRHGRTLQAGHSQGGLQNTHPRAVGCVPFSGPCPMEAHTM